MPSLEIKRCKLAELRESANFVGLLDGYGSESANLGIGTPSAHLDTYQKLEDSGMLHIIGAFWDGALIGFISFAVPFLPHYGAKVGTNESYYVAKEHRGTGAGLALLLEAEVWAKELGAVGYFVSAGVGSVLERVMPRTGYKATNVSFYRALA